MTSPLVSPIHFYDDNYNFLWAWTDNYHSNWTYTIAVANIPTGAKYIRVTGNIARTPRWDAALIVKGIVALLIRVLSGHTPQDILDAELYFIDEIGLKEHLSPTRSNGLLAMVKQMRMYALAFKTKG